MGSQSVTDFSAAKKKHIRELVRDYSPASPRGKIQASKIGAAAVGTLATSRANEFLQALTSRSVETAMSRILSLARELKEAEDPEQVYLKYGVEAKTPRPLTKIITSLSKAHLDSLSATQAETDSAFATKDAIPKTLIDIVSTALSEEAEPTEVDRDKLTKAFRKVRPEKIVSAFLENVASALIDMVLDSTRGSLRPADMAKLKERIREHYVPKFIGDLKKGK